MSKNSSNKLVPPNAREAGSVGGQMVKKMCSGQTASFERANRNVVGHVDQIQYITGMMV